MSRDKYQFDVHRHGGPHIDRYSPTGKLVGRYRPDGTPIPHKGVVPPAVPHADREKFDTEVAKLPEN